MTNTKKEIDVYKDLENNKDIAHRDKVIYKMWMDGAFKAGQKQLLEKENISNMSRRVCYEAGFEKGQKQLLDKFEKMIDEIRKGMRLIDSEELKQRLKELKK